MLQRKTVESGTLELLNALMQLESLSDFALGGGTALALKFGHRVSIDLDLFSVNEFDYESTLNSIRNGLESEVLVQGKAKNTLNLTINGIKVDCLSHRYPSLGENST
ncbi:MAG: nucleotidyl transferase AbiEii/AbiGii toxin family protein, partial [Roseivirga sp.]|nr:nucleotidyl transferase AbiEii/AbiGii toxin family protein [Roseivirga sp.]